MLRLPEDIQVDIFLRLPVNDVLACRWVCSPLRNLLFSPRFVRDHLERSMERNNPRLMVIAHSLFRIEKPLIYTTDYAKLSSEASSRDSRTFIDLHVWERKHYPIEFEKYSGLRIVGSCNGLIAMYSFGKPGKILIWNPVTREYKTIHIPFPDHHPFRRYGFGYDRSTGDYKFVGLSRCQAKIYTLGSESWKTIETIPYKFCPRIGAGSVFINGALHWLGHRSTTDETSPEVIASFDISNERFVEVPAPEKTLPEDLAHFESYESVGVFGDCLCIVVYVRAISYCTVWVMQNYGVKESWSKQITLTEDTIPSSIWYTSFLTKPIWHLKNGEVLMANPHHGFALHDPRNGRLDTVVNVIPRTLSPKEWIKEPVSFVESLVSLNSGTYLENRVKPRPIQTQLQ